MEEIIEKALKFARECHGGDCSGHDFEHILRVLANAERILAAENAGLMSWRCAWRRFCTM